MKQSLKEKEIIMFDLDGTLTASHQGIMNACVYALHQMGEKEPDSAVLMKFIGPPLIESFQLFCGMSEERAKQAVSIYRAYYSEKGLFENEVYKGIPEVLRTLKAAGRTICLATSKPETFAVRILAHFKLDQYFDIIGGSDLSGLRDNKAGVIAAVLEKCAVLAGERKEEIIARTVMIGDRKHDIEGAAVHGLPCIGVLYGYGSEEELLEAGACTLAETPKAITSLLLDSAEKG